MRFEEVYSASLWEPATQFGYDRGALGHLADCSSDV